MPTLSRARKGSDEVKVALKERPMTKFVRPLQASRVRRKDSRPNGLLRSGEPGRETTSSPYSWRGSNTSPG